MTFPTILVAEGAHIYLLLISLPSFLCRSVLVTVCDLLLIRLPHLFSTERVFYWATLLISQHQKLIQLQYNSKTKNSVYTSTNELLSSVRHATHNNTTTNAVVRQSFGRRVLPNVRWLSHRTNSSNYWQWIQQLIHSVTIVRPAIPSELIMTTKLLL